MTRTELLAELRRLKVETGSIACLGCGYEHNCGIHGCAILREAETYIRGADTPRVLVPLRSTALVVGPYEEEPGDICRGGRPCPPKGRRDT